MERLLRSIVERKVAFRGLIALALAMFVLLQVLFRTQLGQVPSPAPDARLHYSSQELVAYLDALGPEGREVYMRLHLLDMAFPLVYGLFFATLLAVFWGGRRRGTVAALAIVPLVGTLSDLAENVCIRIVSAQFAAGRSVDDVAALALPATSLAAVATTVKWTAAALTVLLVLTGAATRLFRGGGSDSGVGS
jgi:hypothetical protein